MARRRRTYFKIWLETKGCYFIASAAAISIPFERAKEARDTLLVLIKALSLI